MKEITPLGQEIRRRLSARDDLIFAVLFGSRATDRARPGSDLDVAVLPTSEADRLDLLREIPVALADLASEGRVDLVFFDEAPPLLRHNILVSCQLLLNRNDRTWKDWRVKTMREHGDREWVYRLYREEQIRRAKEGRPSGRQGRALRSLERSRGILERAKELSEHRS